MEEYKPNSHKSKEQPTEPTQERKLEKVISGNARTKKKGGIQKFTDVFVSEDAHNVKSYILMDVLIPSFKKAISDIVTNGIDMILYGETRRDKKRGPSERVSYNRMYDRENERRDRYAVPARNSYSYDDILLDSRPEAEAVLARMDEAIAEYGTVSVADMYDLVGITGAYTDHKYGWTDIRSAVVTRVRDGYIIKMPRALPL